MSSSVYFNGRWITHPGAYSAITADGITGISDEQQRVVALIGESHGGIPGEVLLFDDPEAARRVLRGGELLKACQKAWSPTLNGEGANLIAVIRSNQATQSKLELNDGIPVSSQIGEVTDRVSPITTGSLIPSGIYTGLRDDQLVVNIMSLGVSEIPEGLAAQIGRVTPTTHDDTTSSLSLSGTYVGTMNDQIEIRVVSPGITKVNGIEDVRPAELAGVNQNTNTSSTGNLTFDGVYDGDSNDAVQVRITSPNGTIVPHPSSFRPSAVGSTTVVSANPSTTGDMSIDGTYEGIQPDNFFQIRVVSPGATTVIDPATIRVAGVDSVNPTVDAVTTGAAAFNGTGYTGKTDAIIEVEIINDVNIDGVNIETVDIEVRLNGTAVAGITTLATDGTDFVELFQGIQIQLGAGAYKANDIWELEAKAAIVASKIKVAYKYATQNASFEQIATITVDGTPTTLMDGLNVTVESGVYHTNDLFQAQVSAEIKATVLQLNYKWSSDGVTHAKTVPVDGTPITLSKGVFINVTPGVYNNNDAWEQEVIAAVEVTEVDIAWRLHDDPANQAFTTATIYCDGNPVDLVHGIKLVIKPGILYVDDRFVANLFAAGNAVVLNIRHKYQSQSDSQYVSTPVVCNGSSVALRDGVQVMFAPGAYFQNDLFFISVECSKPFGDSASVVSKDYGIWTRAVQLKQENGTLRGTKRLTVNHIGTDIFEVYDNVGASFYLKYDGVHDFASVEILQNKDGKAYRLITRVGATRALAVIDLDIDLTVSSFETTKQLIDYITSFAGYYGNVINGSDHKTPTETLDRLTQTTITGFDGSQLGVFITAYWHGVNKVINANSRYLTINKAKPTAIVPQNFIYTALVGGNDGVSPNSWEALFNKLSLYRITYAVALTADRMIQEELKSHVYDMSDVHAKERFMFVGGRQGMPVQDAIEMAYTFNADRVQLVYPGFYDYNMKGELELLPGYMTAAMLAGRAAFKGVAESSTFDEFNVAALEFEPDLFEVEQMLKAGIAPLELVIGDIGKSSKIRLVHDRTTWTRNDISLYTERSVRLLADYLNQKMRNDIEAMSIGKKGVKRTVNSIHVRAVSILQAAVRREEIVAFRNVKTRYYNKVVYIDYEAAPVDPINFALITGHFYTADEIVITDNGENTPPA